MHNKHLKVLNMCTDEVLNFPDTCGTLRVPLVENWNNLSQFFFFLSLFLLQSLRQHLRFVNTKSKKKKKKKRVTEEMLYNRKR